MKHSVRAGLGVFGALSVIAALSFTLPAMATGGDETTTPSASPSSSSPATSSTPTSTPTQEPTKTVEPSKTPSQTPTEEPTKEPTQTPSSTPTKDPSSTPTQTPTKEPSSTPTSTPTKTPTFKAYEVTVWWKMRNSDGKVDTYEFPQDRVGSTQPPATCKPEEYQVDRYTIRDQADEDYLASLTVLNSFHDDASLEPHGYYSIILVDESLCEHDTPVTTPTKIASQDFCGTNRDTFTIPSTEGVTYSVDGVPVDAEDSPFSTNGATTVTVTAAADKGYVLTEGSTTEFVLTFGDNECPPDDATAVAKVASCVGTPTGTTTITVTVTNTEDENAGADRYSVTIGDETKNTGPVLDGSKGSVTFNRGIGEYTVTITGPGTGAAGIMLHVTVEACPVVTPPPTPTPTPTPTPPVTPTPTPTKPVPTSPVDQPDCADLGVTNIEIGSPLYRSDLDSDLDGVACEASYSPPNAPQPPLPNTGGPGLAQSIVAGLMVLAGGLLVARRRKVTS